MKKALFFVLGTAFILAPVAMLAQSKPTAATYITDEEVKAVNATPGVDRTIRVERLVPGDLNRAHSATSEAAGKGVNVSYALATEGVDTVAVLPLATQSAVQYLGLLADAVPVAAVPIAGEMRVNVSIIESDGRVTKVNEPGPPLSSGDADAIVNAAASVSRARLLSTSNCSTMPARN